MALGILAISLTWWLLFISFCGTGLAAGRLLSFRNSSQETIFDLFWIGWVSVLLALQIWHLFVRINLTPLALVIIAGFSVICLERSRLRELLPPLHVRRVALLAIGLLTVWLANRAMGPIAPYDAGLYHLASMRWMTSYPIVPGLANLHDRFGFNSSYFLFQAMLDVGFWSDRSYHLASSLLLLVLVLEIGFSAYKAATKRPVYIHDLVRIVFLAPVVSLCFFQASSTSPDVPNYVIGVLTCVRLCRLLFGEPRSNGGFENVLLIMLLSAAAVTIKLSFVVMGFLASAVAILIWLRRAKSGTSRTILAAKLLPTGLAVVLLLITWVVRNIILTGYPLYPINFWPISVDWKVTAESVANVNSWIQSWARNPNALPRDVLHNWNWIGTWAHQILTQQRFEIVFPLVLFAAGTIVALFMVDRHTFPLSRYFLFMVPALGALIFWFFAAPEPRYAGATFWYLGAGALSLAYGGMSYDRAQTTSIRHPEFVSVLDDTHVATKLTNYSAGS